MIKQKLNKTILWVGVIFMIFTLTFFTGCSLFGGKSTSEKIEDSKNVLKASANVTVVDENNQAVSESAAESLSSMLIILNLVSVNTTEDKIIHISEQKTQQMGYQMNLSCLYYIAKTNSTIRIKICLTIDSGVGYSIMDLNYSNDKLASITLSNATDSTKSEFNIKNNTLKKVSLTSLETQDVVNSVSIVKTTPDIEINE